MPGHTSLLDTIAASSPSPFREGDIEASIEKRLDPHLKLCALKMKIRGADEFRPRNTPKLDRLLVQKEFLIYPKLAPPNELEPGSYVEKIDLHIKSVGLPMNNLEGSLVVCDNSCSYTCRPLRFNMWDPRSSERYVVVEVVEYWKCRPRAEWKLLEGEYAPEEKRDWRRALSHFVSLLV